MTTPAITEDPEQKAHALLDNRVTAVRHLTQTRQAVIDARTALEQAERADATAHATAENSGWSPEYLRKLGLDTPPGAPTVAPAARAPKARRSTARQRTAAGPIPDHSGQGPAA
ncbi:hypothetical protein [Geodermatophilus sp. DF01-2]|uniref:hypothetical protein n=1 Tax=Geodermatophilus sp. DF01-2 TaxID=2559610 RepID=UPI0014307A0E|nr:hypothetical protein [Geodermatophilus sp. DF01_2]